MRKTGAIDYVELPGRNLAAVKRFYREAFDWRFNDFGPNYAAFDGAGLEGGFDADPASELAAPLVVLYSADLADTERRIRAAGGRVVASVAFPGGRRLHFRDPAGNLMAVWTED